jgi:hypothetical protein
MPAYVCGRRIRFEQLQEVERAKGWAMHEAECSGLFQLCRRAESAAAAGRGAHPRAPQYRLVRLQPASHVHGGCASVVNRLPGHG